LLDTTNNVSLILSNTVVRADSIAMTWKTHVISDLTPQVNMVESGAFDVLGGIVVLVVYGKNAAASLVV
jgi:hypothetical protein